MIIGVDEAGRGPLAGPVVAGAVILPAGFAVPVADSKKLSARQRDALYDSITAQCPWAVGVASVAEIEAHNILQATFLAMQRAVIGLGAQGATAIWIDGNQKPAFENFDDAQVKTFVGGDALHAPISAASIIAKVTRDRMMLALDAQYPHYGFARHMGYGTAAHRAAILAHGPCPEHRSLFIRKLMAHDAIAA